MTVKLVAAGRPETEMKVAASALVMSIEPQDRGDKNEQLSTEVAGGCVAKDPRVTAKYTMAGSSRLTDNRNERSVILSTCGYPGENTGGDTSAAVTRSSVEAAAGVLPAVSRPTYHTR